MWFKFTERYCDQSAVVRGGRSEEAAAEESPEEAAAEESDEEPAEESDEEPAEERILIIPYSAKRPRRRRGAGAKAEWGFRRGL